MAKSGERTSLGIDQNLAGLLCYVLGWVTGIVFLILEGKNKFVRFHAVQSIVVFGAFTAVLVILEIIMIAGGLHTGLWGLWLLFSLIVWFLSVLVFILWIVLMLKAYQGTKYRLPVAGKIAAQQSR